MHEHGTVSFVSHFYVLGVMKTAVSVTEYGMINVKCICVLPVLIARQFGRIYKYCKNPFVPACYCKKIYQPNFYLKKKKTIYQSNIVFNRRYISKLYMHHTSKLLIHSIIRYACYEELFISISCTQISFGFAGEAVQPHSIRRAIPKDDFILVNGARHVRHLVPIMRGEGMVPWAYFLIECLVEMHGFQKGGGI